MGKKHDRSKTKWHLMLWDELEKVVKVLEYGEEKYGRNTFDIDEEATTSIGGGSSLRRYIMRLASINISLKYKALEIYLSGCRLKCKGCHNKELWDFKYGELITMKTLIEIENKLKFGEGFLKHIWVLGGEPFNQPKNEIENFILYLKYLSNKYNMYLWLWTGLDDNKALNFSRSITDNIDVLKYGAYKKDLPHVERNITMGDETLHITLASNNQNFLILN